MMPKLICVADKDEQHAKSSVCEGAIAHRADQKDVPVLTIYPEHVKAFELTFYPNLEEGFYYLDPTDRNHYISLNTYFEYMKEVRVAELQKVALDLGA